MAKKPLSYQLARKENCLCEWKMLKTILKTYYPGFQRPFQVLLLSFFVPMFSALSSWVGKLILPPPFNPLSDRPGKGRSPALPGSWPIMSGTRRNWLEWLWSVSLRSFKQRLGFGDYQTRSLQAIMRHTALSLFAYFVLILLKILQWLRDKQRDLNLSIRSLAFQVRKFVLVQFITGTLSNMKISFKQNILDSYFERLCV